MADMALKASDFETEVLESQIPVLLDFWAEWCGPCRMVGPHVEALSTEYAGKAKVYKVDVDSEGELAMRFGVMSIPTLLVIKGGQEVDRITGAAPKDQIAAMIDRAL
ncbi:MAG: thioredoxin [Armatimonadota bacterium]|nr:thioredoxin [Armatimonadota bacterium]